MLGVNIRVRKLEALDSFSICQELHSFFFHFCDIAKACVFGHFFAGSPVCIFKTQLGKFSIGNILNYCDFSYYISVDLPFLKCCSAEHQGH